MNDDAPETIETPEPTSSEDETNEPYSKRKSWALLISETLLNLLER